MKRDGEMNQLTLRQVNGVTANRLVSSVYLVLSWSLLIWLNFSIEPNLFGHFIAIPSLLLLNGYGAYAIAQNPKNKAASLN
ncbi:hypothetical protein AB4298_05180 [Shewanella sp. 10N.261.52.F9]|uniref:hypothetical protein n=1 Tax=Shewanella sp. 10N.261.52.F9 TaxID=3229684 RepID=UPI00354B3777